MLTHKPFPQTAPIVRTRFVMNRDSVGFARKKAQTISFIERGFERLGLSHQTAGLFVVFLYGLDRVRLGSLSHRGGLGGSDFWPFFPAPSPGLLIFPFILACVPYPSSTCRIDIPRLILVPSAHTQSGWGWL